MDFLLINGIGEAMDGFVAPDSEVIQAYCKNCHENTPFIKKVGSKTKVFLWIPLPSKEKTEVTYWECNYCNHFYYFTKPPIVL